MTGVFTEISGLDDAEAFFKSVPKVAAQAASIAINDTITRKGLQHLQAEILGEVNFPKGYLKGDRFGPTRFAKPNNLEGVITARKRATSLARFAAPGTALGSATRTGVRIKVSSTGGSTYMRNAWLVRLRKGASLTEDQYNVGLAVRVRPGERISGKYTSHQSWLAPNVALLYGPSVEQVFNGVAEDSAPEILELLAQQFNRQLERLL